MEFIRLVVASALVVLLLSACDDGTRGELDAKPIYGDMSSLYYGAMCHSGRQELSNLRSRSVRIAVGGGGCAVLYLDGVDPKGALLVYPGGDSVRLQCEGLADKLKKNEAHARVLRRVQEKCGTK
jgi:hypothetical protein